MSYPILAVGLAGSAAGPSEGPPQARAARVRCRAARRCAPALLAAWWALGHAPVRAEPGQEAEGATVPPVLPTLERPPGEAPTGRPGNFSLGVKIGPSLGLHDLPNQLALQIELGVAVTPDRLGRVVLPLQLHVVGEPSALLVPLGFQYDFPLPVRGLYIYPRLSLGYAALLDETGAISHMGVAIAELGLKLVPLRRFSFGLEPVSLPVLFDAGRALVSYRILGYAGVTF